MDSTAVLTLIVGLIVGALAAAVAAWLVLNSRIDALKATHAADQDRLRAEHAQVRVEGADARAAIERANAEAERARTDIAKAQAETSHAKAALAEASSETARAQAERDAALARAEELAADRDAMTAQFKALSAEALERQGKSADASAEQRLKQTEALLTPVRQSLESFNNRLAEVEKERVRMATDLKGQVAAVQLTGQELRQETRALVTALRKPQVRGAWGEMQLKRVVEVSGMLEHCDFEQQHTTEGVDGRIRPDMLVHLSEDKFVFVDAKMPLTSFLDAQETDNDSERARYLDQFARNVRSHVDALSGKQYWRSSDATPEFVVLFMPSEALAAEALQIMPELHEYAASKNVVIATPTTLIAMLRSVAYGWKQALLAGNAAEVSQLGQEVYERLATMGAHFDKLGKALASSVKAYNQTVGSLESRVFVSARKFADLQVSAKPLGRLDGVSEAVRPLAAVELVAAEADALPIETRSPVRREVTTPRGASYSALELADGAEPAAQPAALPEAAHLVRSAPDDADLVTEAPSVAALREIG